MKGPRTSPAGLVASAPIELTGAEKRIVAELVRTILEHQDEIEDRIGAIGRVVLEKCFDDDPGAVFDRHRPRTWQVLLALAGDRRFRIDRDLLSIAVRIAAWDRLIEADAWRQLDPGRKEELLPLADPDAIEEGARQAMALGLNRAELAKWVDEWRETHGLKKYRRRRSLRVFSRRVESLASVLDASSIEQFEEDFAGFEAEERRAVMKQLGRLRERIDRLQNRLRR